MTNIAAKIHAFREKLPGKSQVDDRFINEFWSLVLSACPSPTADASGDSSISSPLNFSGLQFIGPLVFPRPNVDEDKNYPVLPAMTFDSSTFYKEVKLCDVKLLGPFNCRGAAFERGITATRCTFDGKAVFAGARIRGAEFRNCIFVGESDFIASEFFNWSSFAWSQFKKWAYFEQARFLWGVDFSYAQFFGVSFNNAAFLRNSTFEGASFTEWAPKFHEAELHADTSFERASFEAFTHEQD